MIAEYLRLRAHKLKAAAPYSDETMALRTVVRTRGDLVEMRVAATNQLVGAAGGALARRQGHLRRRRVRRSAWSS